MTRKQLDSNELDAMVVRSLARLPSHGPSRAFADRVMDRVQLPSPWALVRYRRARAWVSQPRRALALAGAYAVFATVALMVAVPWLLTHSPAISFAYDWTIGRFAALLRDGTIAVAGWAVSTGLTGFVRSLPLSGPQVWALAFAATLAYAGCAIGLHFLLRAPRGKHAPVQVQG